MATDTKRTKMIHIYTPAGGDYRIEVERETLRAYDDGHSFALPDGERRVRRAFAALAASPLPGGPVMVASFEDLRAIIAACANMLAAEDEADEAARAADLAANNPDANLP